MTHKELIREFAEKASISQKKAGEYLESLESIVYENMADEGGVKLFNGMTVTRSYKNAREGRNPATGEAITIAGRYSPKVKFGERAKGFANA